MTGKQDYDAPARSAWFTEQHFESAVDFVDALRPSNPSWGPDRFGASQWLFRGQWDADWPLLPRLFRSPTDQLVKAVFHDLLDDINAAVDRLGSTGIHPDRLQTVLGTAAAEMELAERFRALAEDVGHSMGSHWMHDGREWLAQNQSSLQPEVHCHPRMINAVAQHHGMPTRALDWTSQPLNAAFFATIGLRQHRSGPDRLAVWALAARCVTPRTHVPSADYRLQRVWLPSSRVAYAHAQQGVLLFDKSANHFYLKTGRWPSIEDSIEGSLGIDKSVVQLGKLTLPGRELAALRRTLVAHRVSHAFLMPSLDNVGRTILDGFAEEP